MGSVKNPSNKVVGWSLLILMKSYLQAIAMTLKKYLLLLDQKYLGFYKKMMAVFLL